MNRNVKILLVAVATFLVSVAAFAAEGAARGTYDTLAAALGIGIAAFGGSLGQGKTASSALEGIGRNPAAADKLFVPMIIGLALIESLVIYAFLVTFVKILA